MTTIYFVRHGEVENPDHINYGRLPGFDLSILGCFQAEKLSRYFKNHPVDFVYCSPEQRSFHTAEAIDCGHPLNVDPRLDEIDLGKWQGIKLTERDPAEVKIFDQDPERVDFLGETPREVMNRVNDFICEVIKKHPGKSILAVSHGEAIASAQVIAKMIEFNDLNKIMIGNGSITKLCFNDKMECVDTMYLKIAPAKKGY